MEWRKEILWPLSCGCSRNGRGAFAGRNTAGIPDIIACVDGRFVAFEVKTETGKLSRLQEVTLGRIRDAGGKAYMVRSAAEVAAIMKEMEVAG